MFSSDASQGLPSAIVVEERFDGVRYRLPSRQLGRFRLLGLLPIAFGVGVAGFAISFIVQMAGPPFDRDGNFDGFFLFFLLFTLPFLYAALKLSKIGLYVLGGHSEVELRGEELRAIECVGPVKWIRKRPVAGIAQFRVVTAPAISTSDSRIAAWFADRAGIVAEFTSAKQMALAVAYPQSWLVPLANDLARRCDLATPDPLTGASKPTVEVAEGSLASSREFSVVDASEVVEQPAESTVVLDQHADGVTLRVPSLGAFRGSKGLVTCGLVFTGLPIAMMVATYWIEGKAPLLVGLICLAFGAVGFGVLISAINMGLRRAVLAVVDDRLLVLQTGLFGSKRREWLRDEIDAIGIGPSGLSVNDQSVLEFQVKPKAGPQFGLLAGRDDAELRWIATVLREALQIPAAGREV